MPATQQSLLPLLHAANQIANEQFAAALGDGDLTVRQVQVLATIEANEGASQTRISNLTKVDRSTLADIVRRLQKQKLIERRRSKVDSRANVLKLTRVGREALAKGNPALASVEEQMLACLPAKDRDSLLDMLGKIVEPRIF